MTSLEQRSLSQIQSHQAQQIGRSIDSYVLRSLNYVALGEDIAKASSGDTPQFLYVYFPVLDPDV